jgi:CheY-like chemotaxis protein
VSRIAAKWPRFFSNVGIQTKMLMLIVPLIVVPMLILVRQLLDNQPYEIEAAVDGQAALEAIAQHQPDVILLDLLMPRLDGFGVLEYLHHTPRYRDIPVIVLTAKTCTAEEQALLYERVRTVIRKQGLERDELIQEVRAALLAYRATTEAVGGYENHPDRRRRRV